MNCLCIKKNLSLHAHHHHTIYLTPWSSIKTVWLSLYRCSAEPLLYKQRKTVSLASVIVDIDVFSCFSNSCGFRCRCGCCGAIKRLCRIRCLNRTSGGCCDDTIRRLGGWICWEQIPWQQCLQVQLLVSNKGSNKFLLLSLLLCKRRKIDTAWLGPSVEKVKAGTQNPPSLTQSLGPTYYFLID